jgi:hypothetical protein
LVLLHRCTKLRQGFWPEVWTLVELTVQNIRVVEWLILPDIKSL